MSSSSEAGDATRARAIAVKFTTGRVRSGRELEARLQRAGVAARLVRQVVNECLAAGLLDDEACARLWAGHWARRGYAWRVIEARLSAKGLAGALIERAAGVVGSGPTADEDRARMVAAVCASDPLDPRGRRRLAQRLAARGFETDLIGKVLSEAGACPSE